MPQVVYYLATAAAGAAFVVQQAVNGALRGAIGSGLWAALTNFLVGAVGVSLAILAMREPFPSLAAAGRIPWYAWTGGALGAVYIVGSIFLLPRIGAAALIGLIIAGQLLTALAIDHAGALGVTVQAMSWTRTAGAALLLAGVAILCIF